MLRAVKRADAQRIWTVRRKLTANVLPLLCGVPFLVAAAWLWILGWGWYAVGLATASLVASAVSLNWLGLAGNAGMKRALSARLKPAPGAMFVGFSKPGYVDILDPHEDLGFLQFDADSLRITGERATVTLLRSREIGLSYEFNPHTLLGVGRWLVIQGKSDTGPVRILVEPRELGSLRANRTLGAKLMNQLDEWRLA